MKPALIGLLVFLVLASVLFTGVVLGKGMTLVEGVTALLNRGTPTPTIAYTSRGAVIEQVRQVQRLETTTFSVERIIEIKETDPRWPDWLRGDKLLLIAQGTVVAGVDLGALREDDVIASPTDDQLVINLPPVSLFNRDSILDNDKTRVYDRQKGILAPANNDLETSARREADRQILQAACDGGIMRQATADAQRAMEKLLALLDVPVVVNAAPVPACPTP